MSKAEEFRKRAAGIRGGIKKRAVPDRLPLERKQKALDDMADNEDWLDGKPPKRLTSAICRTQAANCRDAAKGAMTPAHRGMLDHIADTWDRIAIEIDAQ